MKRIAVFPPTDVFHAQYLKGLLDDEGIECIIQNENVALAGMMERTALAVSPELWVMDDAAEAAARRIVAEVRDAEDTPRSRRTGGGRDGTGVG